MQKDKNNLIFYTNFDLQKYFPLIDFCHNCKDYLNNVIVNNTNFNNEVERYHQDLMSNSFLKKTKNPIWFLNNAVNENMYSSLKTEILNTSAIEYFNNYGLLIFLSEPLNFYKNNFYENDLLIFLNIFAKNNNLKNIKIYTCEKNVKNLNKKYKNLKLFCKNIFLTIVSLEISSNHNLELDFNKKAELIQKKFWCGNGIYNQHRHFVMSFLYSKLGNYSWRHSLDIKKNNKYVPSFQKNINFPENFLKVVGRHSKKYYRRILVNNKKLLKDSPILMDQGFSSKNTSIIKYYDECFCAIVTETYYNSIFADISEKTLYAIAYGKPFILVAPPGSLDYLKQLGFLTFDSIWDESYDCEKNAQKRMLKIYDIIEKIDQLDITGLQILYKKIQPILEHNLEILKNLHHNESILT